MKKIFRFVIFGGLIFVFVYTLFYLYQKSQKKPFVFETETPFKADIVRKTVATGSIKPREEVAIKPQISGIIDALFIEPGDLVKTGDILARIRIVPNMQALNAAENRLAVAQNAFKTNEAEYKRNAQLFSQGVIAEREYQQVELQYQNAKTELEAAKENLEIVREGATKRAGKTSITLVRSTVNGMVLEVPVKVGNQVIESNQFNDGTTIASVANMGDMIFEGLIDESEVGKIREGMALEVTIGAIENQIFPATLEYIAPKGTESGGAIQFEIRARMEHDKSDFIRAGYSANADIVLERRDSVLAIREALLQFDGGKPFVEVMTGQDQYERRDIAIGLSDGLKTEVLKGVNEKDRIKIWNKPL
jgi:HlyD family secretion protein